ncbi:SusD/RagB family nutrient-binding outer membrane lipoprotein [Cytophagaceae bacterium YF14B1]|uniref:SusD/RagB family nutrient-binding outer membrane lipoprotein n=1 Tax=Xanthocytophaga flava TaxID=3048013 RepID=A0AAE3QS67_9BACT|nr:SusD/RagB family nutrient-binding outer membrane lipoprotein [Xanthocytophaga flavus]MDJ1484365.1 SusD/RagB family nutrient-binding outer membrane lipoprotein [Xanthocytophaga flavus]
MKTYIYIFILLSGMFFLGGCQNFKELEKNPNNPTSVPASLVFQGVLKDLYSPTGSEEPWGDVHRWNQFYCINYNYYGNNQYSWTSTTWNYATLKNVLKMEAEALASGAGEVNPYSALAKFFKAYFFIYMTQRVGDIPMTDALKGLELTHPTYDTQKSVFVESLKLLDEANSDLAELITANNTTLSGDFYYDAEGSADKITVLKHWQKLVNTYTLRVLISLSKKEADADLNIKQKFANIINNPTQYPIMTGLGDNLQFTYDATYNKYPTNPGNFGNDATRQNMSKLHIDLLKSLKDPRIFIAAAPAQAKLDAGVKFDDFEAYVGASSGEDLGDMSAKANQGEYSFINRLRYYSNYTGEPGIIVGYSEMCFNIAEAINRGWISGSAEDFYVKGIKASMEFYDITDKGTITIADQDRKQLGTVTTSVTDYLGQSTVKYKGNNADGLTQILTQKYLSFFQNSGFEAFYNQRRTGVPAFLTGVGTGNSARIPKRWLYPQSEESTNAENLSTALQSQFGGTDDINTAMWLLK